MTRVLHILNELRPSGAETMLELAAPYWQSEGIKLAALSTGETTGPFAERLAASGYEIYHLPFRKSPLFFMDLLRLLRRFDAVHIHTERGATEYGITAKAAGVKRVARTVHSHFEFEGRTRQLRILRRRVARLLGVQQVSIGSSVAANEMRRFDNPTLTIVNWYNETRFRPPTPTEQAQARASLELDVGHWAIVSVGNCGPAKNHEAILKALALLPDVVYFHVGAELSDQSERHLAQALGVLNRVRFLGARDPLPMLWGANVYVMPSLYEGFGIAALEAAATGIPCVLADVPGLRDLSSILPTIHLTDTKPENLASALQLVRKEKRMMDTSVLHKQFGVQRGAIAYSRLWR